jgi:uncharacterized membrane protein
MVNEPPPKEEIPNSEEPATTPIQAREQERPPETQSSAEVLPPALEKAIEAAGIDVKTLEISLMMARGPLPLPPPSLLADYEHTHPGLVAKIIAWTEEQRTHRQQLERKRVDGDERRMDRGQLIAGGVAGLGLCLSALVGILGSPYVAGIIAIVAIGGPTAAILLARNHGTPSIKSPATKEQRDSKSETTAPK